MKHIAMKDARLVVNLILESGVSGKYRDEAIELNNEILKMKGHVIDEINRIDAQCGLRRNTIEFNLKVLSSYNAKFSKMDEWKALKERVYRLIEKV